MAFPSSMDQSLIFLKNMAAWAEENVKRRMEDVESVKKTTEDAKVEVERRRKCAAVAEKKARGLSWNPYHMKIEEMLMMMKHSVYEAETLVRYQEKEIERAKKRVSLAKKEVEFYRKTYDEAEKMKLSYYASFSR